MIKRVCEDKSNDKSRVNTCGLILDPSMAGKYQLEIVIYCLYFTVRFEKRKIVYSANGAADGRF